nr:MAG TPA: holin [Caudoviricetes sp.]
MMRRGETDVAVYHGVLGRVALCSDRRRDPCRHPQDQGPVGRGAGPAARPHLYRVLPFYGAGVHHPRRPAQPELPLQDLSCDGRQRYRHGIVQESLRFTHPRLKKGLDIMNAHITENNTPAIPAATIARTVVLALALVNQLLSAAGKPVLPIDSASVEQWVTAGLTTAAAIWAWWENNSFTPEAIRADELLDQMQGKIK